MRGWSKRRSRVKKPHSGAAYIDFRWHWRGFRSGRRWARTMTQIEDWLIQAPSGHDQLIILGASAGWMMPPSFLARFRDITCVDLDLLGRWLFRWRFRSLFAQADRRLSYQLGDAHLLLPRLLRSQPRALILFDNFLGLDSLYTRDLGLTQSRLSALRVLLMGRSWGSIHDRYSGPAPHPPRTPPVSLIRRTGDPLDEKSLIQSIQGSGEWLDHSTGAVLPDGHEARLIAWPIRPGRWHWLEAAWVTPNSAKGD